MKAHRRTGKYCVMAVVAISFLNLSTAMAQSVPEILLHRDSDERPTIMVVGSAHFANPEQDNINIDVEDVLSDEQQEGIRELVDILAGFRPTHVAVEALPGRQELLNKRYAAYRDGEVDLTRSELEQIGMRVAESMEHDRIHAVDWQGEPPGGFSEDYNWYEYAQESGFEDRIAAVSDPSVVERYAVQGDRTIPEWIADMNSLDGLLSYHKVYFDVALIGDSESSPGANWVGHWYTRNLMIFNNIVRLAQSRSDRILVIYGAGHAYLLRQFAIESGAFDVVDLND